MFDIGFWELCLIAVVALLILGPERLPVAARTAGLWISKARKMINNVKSEIERELQLDELRQRLSEEETNIRKNYDIAENTIADIEDYTDDTLAAVSESQSNPDKGIEKTNGVNDSGHGEYEPESTESEPTEPDNTSKNNDNF